MDKYICGVTNSLKWSPYIFQDPGLLASANRQLFFQKMPANVDDSIRKIANRVGRCPWNMSNSDESTFVAAQTKSLLEVIDTQAITKHRIWILELFFHISKIHKGRFTSEVQKYISKNENIINSLHSLCENMSNPTQSKSGINTTEFYDFVTWFHDHTYSYPSQLHEMTRKWSFWN